MRTIDGVRGTSFVVWAPNAKRVSVIGDFNHWDGRLCPMRSLGMSGIWELFVPGIEPGELYKYEIKAHDGRVFDILAMLEHYNSGVINGPTTDPLVRNKIPLSNFEKGQLVAFLSALTDTAFLRNKSLSEPQ